MGQLYCRRWPSPALRLLVPAVLHKPSSTLTPLLLQQVATLRLLLAAPIPLLLQTVNNPSFGTSVTAHSTLVPVRLALSSGAGNALTLSSGNGTVQLLIQTHSAEQQAVPQPSILLTQLTPRLHLPTAALALTFTVDGTVTAITLLVTAQALLRLTPNIASGTF